jgi:hypothetical protein
MGTHHIYPLLPPPLNSLFPAQFKSRLSLTPQNNMKNIGQQEAGGSEKQTENKHKTNKTTHKAN